MPCPCCGYTCPPCPEGNCYFPGSGLIFDGYYPCTEDVASPCCTNPSIPQKARYRLFYTSGLPCDVSWKAGYPAALAGCNWRWCYDEASVPCYREPVNTCSQAFKFRYRLLVLNCAAESYDDITSLAAEGALEGEFIGAPCQNTITVSECRETPTWLDFLPGPEPICPP